MSILYAMAAFALLTLCELLAVVRGGITVLFLNVAVLCLCLAGRPTYFVMAGVLFAVGNGLGFYRLKASCWPIIDKLLVPFLALVFHMFASYLLPLSIVWEWSNAFESSEFASQELGHTFVPLFSIGIFVVLPLLFASGGASNAVELQLQRIESTAMMLCGILSFLIFTVSHQIRGRYPLPSVDWTHEMNGVLYTLAGGVGLATSSFGQRTVVHVVVPTILGGVMMLQHTHGGNMHGDSSEMESLEQTLSRIRVEGWMALHQWHGAILMAGAVARLLHKVQEACCLFSISFVLVSFSARQNAYAMVDFLFLHVEGHEDIHKVLITAAVLAALAFHALQIILIGRNAFWFEALRDWEGISMRSAKYRYNECAPAVVSCAASSA